MREDDFRLKKLLDSSNRSPAKTRKKTQAIPVTILRILFNNKTENHYNFLVAQPLVRSKHKILRS